MIYESIEKLQNKLLKMTKEKKLDWKPISALGAKSIIMDEYFQRLKYSSFENNDAVIDYSLSTSYFIQNKHGYVVLVDLICKNDSGPIYHKLQLLTKINDYLPLSNDMDSELHGSYLETLKLNIEIGISEKFQLPNTLYEFWDSIT